MTNAFTQADFLFLLLLPPLLPPVGHLVVYPDIPIQVLAGLIIHARSKFMYVRYTLNAHVLVELQQCGVQPL